MTYCNSLLSSASPLLPHPTTAPHVPQPLLNKCAYSGAVLLERVEGMVSLGAWVSLGVHVTQWHGRLILAVLDISMRVTLHAVSPGTLEVSDAPLLYL